MLSISSARTASQAVGYHLHLERDSLGRVGEYYTKEGEPGAWMGTGANALGLSGQLTGAEFERLASGFAPDGAPLARNAGDPDRRAGWDLTFSAPKSVSVAWGIADPVTRAAIETAHRDAVRQAFAVLQEHAAYARTGAQGRDLRECELVAAEFVHGSSRELDAQLHSHVFVFNVGLLPDREPASIDSQPLFDYKMAAGAAYQCALAHGLAQAGFQVERDGPEACRLASVPRALEEAQSTRRAQIEAELDRTGRSGAKAAAVATLATRQAKNEPGIEELRSRWTKAARAHGVTADTVKPILSPSLDNQRNSHEPVKQYPTAANQHHARSVHFTDRPGAAGSGEPPRYDQLESLNNLRQLPGGGVDGVGHGAPQLLPRDARDHLVSKRADDIVELRRSTALSRLSAARPEMPSARAVLDKATELDAIVTRADLLRDAYRLSIGAGSAGQASAVAARAQRQAVHVARRDGQRDLRGERLGRYTSRSLMKAERDVLRIAHERKGENWHALESRHIASAVERVERDRSKPGEPFALNAEQRAAVEQLSGKPGGVQVLVGDAGTGKSTTMAAVRCAHEAAGLRVLGTSTGTKASAELASSAGIESRNIAKLLIDLERGREHLDSKTVLVVDEAGMVASREMAALMRAADEAGAKVILVGDYKQLQPVGAGETLRAIDKECAGARLESNARQREAWEREAVKQLSQGEAAAALRTYAAQDRVHIDSTYKAAIADVAARHIDNMRAVGPNQSLALAATNRAVDDINAAVRTALQRSGALDAGVTVVTRDDDRNSGTREIEVSKGDRIVLGSNDKEGRFANGDAGTVARVDPDRGTVELTLDRTGERVQVDARDVEIRHAYAMTTHKAQGSTVERATVYIDAMSSRELAYVQASRARESTHFVATSHTVKEMRAGVETPAALKEAVERVGDAREALGKDRGVMPEHKESMQAAVEFLKENKGLLPADLKPLVKEAQTFSALAEAMGRSRPKETTLDFREVRQGPEKQGQQLGREGPMDRVQKGPQEPDKSRPLDESVQRDVQSQKQWDASLTAVEKAVWESAKEAAQKVDLGQDRQEQQGHFRER